MLGYMTLGFGKWKGLRLASPPTWWNLRVHVVVDCSIVLRTYSTFVLLSVQAPRDRGIIVCVLLSFLHQHLFWSIYSGIYSHLSATNLFVLSSHDEAVLRMDPSYYHAMLRPCLLSKNFPIQTSPIFLSNANGMISACRSFQRWSLTLWVATALSAKSGVDGG